MKLSQQTDRTSNHITWLLAIAFFLSCFTFSISTDNSKADEVKTKTELVITAKGRVRKILTVNSFVYNSLRPTDFHPSKISDIVECHNQFFKVHFDFVSKNYLTFSSDFIYNSLFSKIPDNDLSSLVG